MNKKDSKKIFRQPINYENGVLLPKIKDISLWRDTNIKAYESGVITMAILLPKELREKALDFLGNDTTAEDLTKDGKQNFDRAFVFILELLEENNICFPQITFDLGHD